MYQGRLTFGSHHEVPRVGVRVHVAVYQGHLRKQLHEGQAHRPRVDPLTLELRLVCKLDALGGLGYDWYDGYVAYRIERTHTFNNHTSDVIMSGRSTL